MNDRLREWGRELARHQDQGMLSPPLDASDVMELATAAHHGARRRERVRRQRLAAVGSLAAAAVIALFVGLRQPGPLNAELAGAPVAAGAKLAAETAEQRVDFSDGSAVFLTPGTRATLDQVTGHGSHWTLKTGALRANVVPRDGNDWRVAAGPFRLRVIGTEFAVTWDADRHRFSLGVDRGKVGVTGPTLASMQTVGAGERLDISIESDAAKREPEKAEKPPATEVEQPAQETARGGTPSEPAATQSWRELAKLGRTKQAWARAQSEGVAQSPSRLGAQELLELADVALLAGNPTQAAGYLRLLRERFAGSGSAAVAAYTLGVIAFDQSGDIGAAQRMFQTYLRERPSGSLAPQALGRLMECQSRLGKTDAARETARRYLRAYPDGLHRDIARRLVGEN